MRIRLIVALVAAFAMLGAGAATASAGCQAIGGASSWRTDNSVNTNHGIECTSNNGSHYQVRMYMQANSGGFHAVTPAISADVFSPPTNFRKLYSNFWSCGYLAAADTQVRAKTVVENIATGSTDVAYGPATTVPASCQ